MPTITTKDLYDRLEANRIEHHQAIERLIERLDKRDAETRAEIAKLNREIYGNEDSKGMKYHVTTNTAKIISMDVARGISEWRQFIVTMVAAIIAAVTGVAAKP